MFNALFRRLRPVTESTGMLAGPWGASHPNAIKKCKDATQSIVRLTT
jgi:hypothetical protein